MKIIAKDVGGTRSGLVRLRSQFLNHLTGLFIKRSGVTGRFLDVKTTLGKFKGVRREKKG